MEPNSPSVLPYAHWSRFASTCAWELCEDTLIEPHSKVVTVKIRKKNGTWWTRSFHKNCYDAERDKYLDDNDKVWEPPTGGGRKPSTLTPRQAKTRRNLNTQMYVLRKERTKASMLIQDPVLLQTYIGVLNKKVEALLERYDEVGGRPTDPKDKVSLSGPNTQYNFRRNERMEEEAREIIKLLQ